MARALGPVVLAGALCAACSASAATTADRQLAGADGQRPGAAGEVSDLLAGGGRVMLRGAEEVPGPGDPTGSGTAEVVLVADRSEVCVEIVVQGIDQPNAAHLHAGVPGDAGDVVLALPAPPTGDGSVDACVSAAADVIARLRADPEAFYVNVHTAAMPDGALRGQLG